jgi:glutathione S-transferase
MDGMSAAPVILIGQFDSPFVRRVGIALELYGLAYEHRPWSVGADAGKIAAHNPLTRVPTLVLDDGESLIETHAILDHLDSRVPPERRLYPVAEPARRRAMRIASLAGGLSDKAVALFYELRFHEAPSAFWADRCRGQIRAAAAALETERAAISAPFWFGDALGHADIAVAASLRHANEAHPGLIERAACPALAAHCGACEALPVFRKISQAFVAPA